jgi:succinate-acetate transporter protein
MVLMGWGGASGLAAVAGIFFFTGPALLLLSTIFLWIQAQFFSMMVCGLFSVFWLSFGMLQLPSLELAGAYAGGDAVAGAASREMNAVVALYLLVWGFALGTFWIFTLRINVVFAGIFGFVTVGVWVLSAAYWAVSTGNLQKAIRLQKVCTHIKAQGPFLQVMLL